MCQKSLNEAEKDYVDANLGLELYFTRETGSFVRSSTSIPKL